MKILSKGMILQNHHSGFVGVGVFVLIVGYTLAPELPRRTYAGLEDGIFFPHAVPSVLSVWPHKTIIRSRISKMQEKLTGSIMKYVRK